MTFYIHHIYSYELFWYFFHGADINPKEIPTWFYKNRHNRYKKIDFDVTIKFLYKGIECIAIFSDDRYWNKDDGHHLFDYNLDLIQKEIIGDRGWNSTMDLNLNEYINFLNEKSKKLKNHKIKFFYINWEPFSKEEPKLFLNLNKNIELYTDNPNHLYTENQYYSFSHFLTSFIWPNTIGLREFYFMADYIKNIKKFECKINYPIRRITKSKVDLYKKIQKFNNKEIRCSISSFTDYGQHEKNIANHKIKLSTVIKNGENIKYIKKRGYCIDDWGGEWNDSNMNEFKYKLLDYSHINIICEPETHITEKSILHILAGKPFIPQFYKTVEFFNDKFKKYDLECDEYPMNYVEIKQMIDILEEIVENTPTFNYILQKLQIWVDSLRNNFISVIHNHNDMLDITLSLKTNKNTNII